MISTRITMSQHDGDQGPPRKRPRNSAVDLATYSALDTTIADSDDELKHPLLPVLELCDNADLMIKI
jgi:hypothetical protein